MTTAVFHPRNMRRPPSYLKAGVYESYDFDPKLSLAAQTHE
jgi:hypothetical protein